MLFAYFCKASLQNQYKMIKYKENTVQMIFIYPILAQSMFSFSFFPLMGQLSNTCIMHHNKMIHFFRFVLCTQSPVSHEPMLLKAHQSSIRWLIPVFGVYLRSDLPVYILFGTTLLLLSCHCYSQPSVMPLSIKLIYFLSSALTINTQASTNIDIISKQDILTLFCLFSL